MIKTETDIQMRFADVDILGHVNNVNLQHYFDIGKSAYFEEVLDSIAYICSAQMTITAATNTSYFAQTKPHEKIYVETSIESFGTKSLTIYQRIISRQSGEVKAESRSVMVAFDFDKQESIPVPQEWRKKAGH